MSGAERYVWHMPNRGSQSAPITRQRVVKETDQTMALYGPRWGWATVCEWRCTDKAECFERFDQAKDALVRRLESAERTMRENLADTRAELKQARAMKEPTE